MPRQPNANRTTTALFLLALFLLLIGLFWPTMTITKFFIFEETYSIVLVIIRLAQKGEALLFLTILVFSVLFPLAKILLALVIIYGRRRRPDQVGRLAKWLGHLGKWSMLDVLVVALTVVVIEVGSVVDVRVHAGIFLFGLSVVIAAWATLRLQKTLETDREAEPPPSISSTEPSSTIE